MRAIIHNNVSVILLLFCILGFIVPGLAQIPTNVVVVLLAIVIFLGGFKIQVSQIMQVKISRIILFLILRFILLPIAIFFLVKPYSDTIALSLLLLGLLPPGTSSPTMSHVFNGNVALAFILLIVGSLVAPFVIPFIISMVVSESFGIPTKNMLVMLAGSILIPVIFFLMLRKINSLNAWANRDGPVVSILLIGITLTIAVAKRKTAIIQSPEHLLLYLIISSFAILLFYIVGWIFFKNVTVEEKISYSLCSGANNLSLGISIALLYFPPSVVLFLIATEIPWVFSFIPFKRFVRVS